MNRLKKLLAILLTVATLCSLLPAVALAEEIVEVPEEAIVELDELAEVPAEEAEIVVLPEEEPAEETEAVIEEAEIVEEAEEAIPEEEIAEEPAEEIVEEPAEEVAEEVTEEAAEEVVEEVALPENFVAAQSGVNPYYKNVIDADAVAAAAAELEVVAPAADADYYTTYAQMGAALRTAMKNRSGSVNIYLKTKSFSDTNSWWYNMMDQVMAEACKHTGVANEGDYLMWHWASWSIPGFSYSTSNGYYYLPIVLKMTYYTTASQETAVANKVNSVIKSLNISNCSDYTKVKKIYDYLCDNVVYDYDNLYDDDYTLKYTAYAALLQGTSVCQGYANAFYRMCLTAGVDCREVPSIESECHIWNIAKLDGKYWNLDATWDAGNWSYQWFLQSNSQFTRTGDHTRDAEYRTSSFNSKYPMGTDSVYWAINHSDDAKVTGIENTANGIKLSWDKVTGVSGYRIYRKTYSSDNWSKVATVSGSGTTYYVDTATKNQNGPVYQYRITGYTTSAVTSYSNTKSIARLPSPTIEKLYAGNNHNAVVQWTENSKVSGYELKWRTGSDTQKIVIGGSENFKKTITALSKGKTYAVQVRSFKSANGNRYYSGWSGIRNVTAN